MDIKRSGDLTQVGEKVRIERGPVMKTEKATKALLKDDKTAAHYQAGKVDALGKEIVEGKDMTYVDWIGGEAEFKLYEQDDDGAYQLVKAFPIDDNEQEAYDAALSAAVDLAS